MFYFSARGNIDCRRDIFMVSDPCLMSQNINLTGFTFSYRWNYHWNRKFCCYDEYSQRNRNHQVAVVSSTLSTGAAFPMRDRVM